MEPATGRLLRIEQLHVKVEQLRAFRDFRPQGVLELFARNHAPQGIKVRLGIDLQAVLVHATVQVDCQLRYAEQLVATESLESHLAAFRIGENARVSQVAVQPARENRAAVYFGVERLHATGNPVGMGRNLQGREIRMGKRNAEPGKLAHALGDTDGNQGRIPHNAVALAGFNPCRHHGFVEAEPGRPKGGNQTRDRMRRGDRIVQEFKKIHKILFFSSKYKTKILPYTQ